MTDHKAALEPALADAHLPALAAGLVHITGDMSLVGRDRWPVYDFFGDSKLGGFSAEVQAEIRDKARAALEAQLAGAAAPKPLSEAIVRQMMDFVAGAEIP